MSSTIKNILSTARRIPYKDTAPRVLQIHMESMDRNRLDLTMSQDWAPLLLEGLLMLRSDSLDMDFLFINIDSGKGFFGGQKTSIATYISRDDEQSYEAGPVLKNLIQALTGINNIYRDAGILNGIAR